MGYYRKNGPLKGKKKPTYFLDARSKNKIVQYFTNIKDRSLDDFTGNWDALKRLKNISARHIVQILHHITRDMPNHQDGSAAQRHAISHLKKNFSVWENQALKKLDSFAPRNLSISLWAMAVLGVTPSQNFMDKIHDEFKTRLNSTNLKDKLSTQSFSNSLWALAILQSQNPDLNLKPIFETIRDKIRFTQFKNKIAQKQIYDADLYFTGKSEVLNPERKGKSHPSEERLANIFKRAGYKVQKPKKCPIPQLNQAIDRVLIDKQGRRIFLEVDGDTHFNNPEAKDLRNLKYNLATRFRSALMTRLSPKAHIIRIDFKMFIALEKSDRKKQDGFCKAVFDKAIERGPGCYHVSALGELLTDMVPKPTHQNPAISSASSAATSPRPTNANDNAGSPAPHTRPNSQSAATHHAPTGVQ